VTVRHGRVADVEAVAEGISSALEPPSIRRLRDTIIGDWYDPNLFEEA
jgi:hypothetical protein